MAVKEKKEVKVSTKGQITIPKEVREDLKITPGDRLDLYRTEDGKYVIEKRSPLKELAKAMAEEAKKKGYTEQDLKASVENVRDRLWKELYKDKVNH